MTYSVNPNDWKPVGVAALEEAAEAAVRSTINALVIAGPGAGKTELLAQRACYLLQSGLCSRPKRILAISFKRDAARNLHDRVLERCGRESAQRFDSMTFDAFAKSLLDRFRAGLPIEWRPTANYELDFQMHAGSMRKRLEEIPDAEGGLTQAQLAALNTEKLYWSEFVGRPLSVGAAMPAAAGPSAARALWTYLLRHGGKSLLNFQMISRLAELLLRSNPKILTALRATYSFVFLDEFQDTTGIQYDLTRTAFHGSAAFLTAVGDNKQRIMGWAGALPNVFESYQKDFGGEVLRLKNNHRSAPELVRILSYLTLAIDKDAVAPVAVDDGSKGKGECRVLLFPDHIRESQFIADLVSGLIANDGLRPRDICVLTRNRAADYTQTLRQALQSKGIEARVESELQDMLSEAVSTIVLHTLKLASRKQSPESRTAILDVLVDFEGGDAEAVGHRVENELRTFISDLRGKLKLKQADEAHVKEIVQGVVNFFRADRLAATFPQYSQGSLLTNTVEQFSKALSTYLQDREWSDALDALEGLSSVPVMTMHKSKGLEYHTVIFVGLEDSALWSFAKNQDEETCGFFVALSRARKRVLFTFCQQRPKAADQPAIAQQRNSIGKLYDLLNAAGVVPEQIA